MIAQEGHSSAKTVSSAIYIPKSSGLTSTGNFSNSTTAILILHGNKKGCDVDKPRNLAKSVTVE